MVLRGAVAKAARTRGADLLGLVVLGLLLGLLLLLRRRKDKPVEGHTFSRLRCRWMIIRRAGTEGGICAMTCQSLYAPENTLTSLARQGCQRIFVLLRPHGAALRAHALSGAKQVAEVHAVAVGIGRRPGGSTRGHPGGSGRASSESVALAARLLLLVLLSSWASWPRPSWAFPPVQARACQRLQLTALFTSQLSTNKQHSLSLNTLAPTPVQDPRSPGCSTDCRTYEFYCAWEHGNPAWEHMGTRKPRPRPAPRGFAGGFTTQDRDAT